MFEEDVRYTVREIAAYVIWQPIIKSKLRRICARWVPHLLTKTQKGNYEKCTRESLKTNTNCQNKRINEMLTGDGTWM